MKVIRTSDVEVQESTSKIFRGKVSIQEIVGKGKDKLRVKVINFDCGAVNVYHTHTFDQILYVLEGRGIVATEKEKITATPGTWIIVPASERHWHGATKDTTFSHIAIMPPGETSF